MSDEIQRLNPGLVVSARPLPSAVPRRAVALTHKSRRGVLAELERRQRRGEVESAGQLQFITEGPLAGQYAVRVVLLPARPDPKLYRAAIAVGSVLGGLSLLVLAVTWFLASLSPVALATLCLTVLGMFVGWVKVRHGRSRATVVINQNVNVGR